MEKLELFWSDFIGFIPSVISGSIAKGSIIVSLIIVFFVVLVSVLSVEGLSAAGMYSFMTKYIRIRKRHYLTSVKTTTLTAIIVSFPIILMIYFIYPTSKMVDGNAFMVIIYGVFTMVIYAVLKYFYLKRKYERRYGKLE